MYTKEKLEKYSYFRKLLEKTDIFYILDPLTGLLTRPHIIGLVKSLIDENIPFTFAMLDLDNFKDINDHYGHTIGDKILSAVSKNLMDYLGDFGVAGRFGGDEILFVNMRDLTYDDKKEFCTGMYLNDTVLKMNYKFGDLEIFMTGTIGMATFPDDAKNYDEMFALIDKTLYRGKSKGRNCYIIYVEAKHKHLQIVDIRKNNLYEIFRNIEKVYDSDLDIYGKLKNLFETIRDDLHISDMYYVGRGRMLYSVVDDRQIGAFKEIDELCTDRIVSYSDLDPFADSHPEIHKLISRDQIGSFLALMVDENNNEKAYIILAEPGVQRLWQNEDYAIMFVVGKALSIHLKSNDEYLK